MNCRASCREAAGARSKNSIMRGSERKKKISGASSGVTFRRWRRPVFKNGNGSKFRCSTFMVLSVFRQLFQKLMPCKRRLLQLICGNGFGKKGRHIHDLLYRVVADVCSVLFLCSRFQQRFDFAFGRYIKNITAPGAYQKVAIAYRL